MAENSNIAWTDHTWNPWIGCSRVHTGCLNCYAEAQQGRFGVTWGPAGSRRKTSEAYWKNALHWNRVAESEGNRLRVFPSLCDPFEDWQGPIFDHKGMTLAYKPSTPATSNAMTMPDLRRDFFDLIDKTPNIDWLLLTKRPQNIRRMWPMVSSTLHAQRLAATARKTEGCFHRRDNVQLIYSASDQETLDTGLPHLLECRALSQALGLSLEPLVGPVDLRDWLGQVLPSIHNNGNWPLIGPLWVIVGGESGPKARPCNIEWILSIIRQCADAGVPCFVKQLGSKPYMSGSVGARFDWPCGYTVTGGDTWLNLIDKKGGDMAEWPEDLRVRQFPSENQGD